MAYTPLNLKDGTKVTSTHTTHIEAGITDCEDQITELKDSLTEFGDSLSNLKVYCSYLPANGSKDFSYTTYCIIFASRASNTSAYNSWLCDQWSGVVALSDNTGFFTVTASNRVATLTSTLAANLNYIVFAV